MRFLVVLVVFAVPVRAEEKDEDKAREAVRAFNKAVLAKDLDAVMQTVDAPFVMRFDSPDDSLSLSKLDDLKAGMAEILKQDNSDLKSQKAGKVYDMAGIAKYAKENKLPDLAKQAEKIVGKSGYMVMQVKKGDAEDSIGMPMLVRIKDGKAFVAGLPK